MLILIDNYDSFTYNLVHFLGELGAKCEVYRNDKITPSEVIKRRPKAIVLSPGPCTPNEAGICLDLVNEAKEKIPIFGVCLGHQAIAQALGGKIVRTKPMHGKMSSITHSGKGVFKGLKAPLDVTRYHSLVVARKSLPKGFTITAETADGLIMGFEHQSYALHGVQFHPESIASEAGHDVLANFLEIAGIKVMAKRRTQHKPAA